MQSHPATAVNTGRFATLLIVGGALMAAFFFFMDTPISGDEGVSVATNRPPQLPTSVTSDLESIAKNVQTNLAASAESVIGDQLAAIRAQLPSVDSFIGSQPPSLVESDQQPTPTAVPDQPPTEPVVIQPISEVVYPTPTPTNIPLDPAIAPTYHTAVLSDGRKHIMTTQRIYMACSDMFMEYGGNINMQYGYHLYNWFTSLSNQERGVYYYQCTRG